MAPRGRSQRRGRINRSGQRLQRAPQVGLGHCHRLPEVARSPLHIAFQHRQGFAGSLMTLIGQLARVDVFGQSHQLQERLRLRVRRQFLTLEGGDLVVSIVGRHVGTSSISSAACL